MTLRTHKTKIIATIGPASESQEVMISLINCGMNIARLNFSHGDLKYHANLIYNLRAASKATEQEIAIMADLPGPKMRIGKLKEEPIQLEAGAFFTLTANDIIGDRLKAAVSFKQLPKVVHIGDCIFLNDGIIKLEVFSVDNLDVNCKVLVGGELRSRKGINIPNIDLGVGAFTERDKECLFFALEHGVDAVSQSFVESAADIKAVKEAARSIGKEPFVIAKIERSRALDKLDEILEAADGIMVARGDLGVEVPIEQIAIIQKNIIHKAVTLGKPVIVATQMLESMTHSSQPTRAEATDVANAVLDGTDCVMLSGESANGNFPKESVCTLAKIAAATEPHRPKFNLIERLSRKTSIDREFSIADLLSLSVETVIECAHPAAVIVPTRSGVTARGIARFHLPVWVAAPTSSLAVCRELQFSYGVIGELESQTSLDWSKYARNWVKTQNLKGNLAILIQGPSTKHPEANHRMEILDIS